MTKHLAGSSIVIAISGLLLLVLSGAMADVSGDSLNEDGD